MTPARFALQAALVLALIVLVTWPQYRQLGASALGPPRAPKTRTGEVEDTRGRSGASRSLIGYGSASEATLGANGASALYRKLYENDVEGRSRKRAPADVLSRGGKINGIVGYALTASNSPIPFARVVLRNLATGVIEGRGFANEQGEFTFLDVMPGKGYIVELLDANGNVIATSELIAIDVSDLRETLVRLSGQQAAAFGGSNGAQAAVAAAANGGVNRMAAPEQCASPPCGTANR